MHCPCSPWRLVYCTCPPPSRWIPAAPSRRNTTLPHREPPPPFTPPQKAAKRLEFFFSHPHFKPCHEPLALHANTEVLHRGQYFYPFVPWSSHLTRTTLPATPANYPTFVSFYFNPPTNPPHQSDQRPHCILIAHNVSREDVFDIQEVFMGCRQPRVPGAGKPE